MELKQKLALTETNITEGRSSLRGVVRKLHHLKRESDLHRPTNLPKFCIFIGRFKLWKLVIPRVYRLFVKNSMVYMYTDLKK